MTPAQMGQLDHELREYFESMVKGMGRLERRRAIVLLRLIGHCPLCLRHVGARAPPCGPSRI